MEKYFSDGVPLENNIKIKFFCGFTIRNNFSVGLTCIMFAQIKTNFSVLIHTEKRNKRTEKHMFFFCRSR